MPSIPLGHRLARELSRRGDRRAYFRTAQYRELRRIVSVEELADFLDRTGYKLVRASENIEQTADDIMLAGKSGCLLDTLGLLLLPVVGCWRFR